jgi:nitrogen-specific signal transduction histidine kinase/HD-like signal output (HDOD) protein
MKPVTTQLMNTLEITNLPSLPHVLLRVLDICNRDSASLKAIADILSQDAALSAKIFGASTTVQFNRHNKLNTLEQTLAVLGLDMVKTIAISSSFYQVFNNLNISPGFDLKTFWARSLSSAVLSKLIAEELDYPHIEEAYLTGLLLNIGQLVLWSNFPKQYVGLLADKTDDNTLLAQETEKLGNNHCEVGAWLVNKWNLNSFMADAVRYHHMPQNEIADAQQLIQITHIADKLTALNAAEQTEQFSAGEKILGISSDRFQNITNEAQVLVRKVAQSLGIEIDTLETNEQDNMRQQKMQLAVELRDIVLIGRNPLGTGSGNSLEDTLASIQRSVQILFGIQDMAFFLPDQQGKSLKGECLTGHCAMLNQMLIPLNKKNSIVTKAFLTRVPTTTLLTSEAKQTSIPDEQITRLMQTEGFYCQPMFTQNSVVGIMIFGLNQTQLSYVKKQQKLMTLFAQQAAQAIASLNAITEQEIRIKSEVQAASRIQALQIMHETSNPLSIIQNYIQLLGIRLPKEDPAQEDLKIIKQEIDRVTRLCQTATANTDENPQQKLNANDIINNLYRIFLEPLFALHQVTVQTQLDPALPHIMVNKDKLIQVLINLMKNAAEAMQNGGTLLISTRVNTMRSGIEYVEIAIKDDGPGIPADIMENMYKPITSGKGSKHAGLGLSIVRNIIDELGGKIFCQSNEISGTVFQILLPLSLNGRNKP